jgi:hypothetical protein
MTKRPKNHEKEDDFSSKMTLFYRISVVLITANVVLCVRYNEYDRDKRKILPKRVQVQTDYGRIEGWDVDLGWTKQKYKHVHYFFGIPYAKPPYTELRFKVKS